MMKENYCFCVSEKFKNIIINCIKLAHSLNIPISNSIYFGENKGYSYYGKTCLGKRLKKTSGYDFYITINKFLLEEKDIYQTVIHELLHTVKDGMNHTRGWRKYREVVNKNTPFKITTFSKCKMESGAYKRKKVFSIEEYDKNTMDIIECPKCKKRWCLIKSLRKNNQPYSKYYCKTCREKLIYK